MMTSSMSSAARCVARADLRNFWLALAGLHISAILLRSGLRLLVRLFGPGAGLRTFVEFVVQSILFVPNCVWRLTNRTILIVAHLNSH